ncbi:MAG: ATP phosphoribosyltransferase, partial [Patescibacteria group bacterium]
VLESSLIQNVADLQNGRIATSYPNLLMAYLEEEKVNADILTLKGSVEIVPTLNLADAICDLTQTGKTLKENNLRPIATILESQAILIQSPFLTHRAVKGFELLFEKFSKKTVSL